MAMAYSVDLRMRVVEAVDGGESVDDVAERFEVTPRTVWNWLALRKSTGGVEPQKGAVGPKPKLDEHREKIEAAIKAAPSLTLSELHSKLELPGCITTLWNAIQRWGLSCKKSDVAAEQLRPEVQSQRTWWDILVQRQFDLERFVFVDEAAIFTPMSRR